MLLVRTVLMYVNKHLALLDLLNTYCTMLHLFKNNDRYRAIYGNLENKINTLYWPVKNSIHKNNDADDR